MLRITSNSFEHDWSFAIRWFNIISGTLIWGVLPCYRDAIGVFYSLSWVGSYFKFSVLFDNYIGLYQVLPLQAKINLGAIVMNEYSTKLQHYWSLTVRLFNVISRPLIGGFCSQCILQPQPTGLKDFKQLFLFDYNHLFPLSYIVASN